MQTIQIEVQQETAKLLMEKAAARNLSLDEYLREIVEIDNPPQMKTLDEILAPFRAEVEAKGYSEDELDDLFTEARKEVFQAKQQMDLLREIAQSRNLTVEELRAEHEQESK